MLIGMSLYISFSLGKAGTEAGHYVIYAGTDTDYGVSALAGGSPCPPER